MLHAIRHLVCRHGDQHCVCRIALVCAFTRQAGRSKTSRLEVLLQNCSHPSGSLPMIQSLCVSFPVRHSDCAMDLSPSGEELALLESAVMLLGLLCSQHEADAQASCTLRHCLSRLAKRGPLAHP